MLLTYEEKMQKKKWQQDLVHLGTEYICSNAETKLTEKISKR